MRWRGWLTLGVALLSGCGATDKTDAQRSIMADESVPAAGTQGGAGGGGAAIPDGKSPASTQAPAAPSGLPPAPVMQGMAAGSFKPSADLDPNAKFDWPETAPGAGQCPPGTYVGMFGCSLFVDPSMPPPDGTPPDFSGPITLEFKKSADGEFLELANAKLDGSANDTLGFTADLNGKLDCSTLELTATLSNGVYGLGSPILLPGGDVNGTVSGMLDPQTGQLTGTWSLYSSAAGTNFSCDGSWQAVLTP